MLPTYPTTSVADDNKCISGAFLGILKILVILWNFSAPLLLSISQAELRSTIKSAVAYLTMNYGGSYQNSGGYGMAASTSASSGMHIMSETEYQRLSQTVGTNIQKMIQNGE